MKNYIVCVWEWKRFTVTWVSQTLLPVSPHTMCPNSGRSCITGVSPPICGKYLSCWWCGDTTLSFTQAPSLSPPWLSSLQSPLSMYPSFPLGNSPTIHTHTTTEPRYIYYHHTHQSRISPPPDASLVPISLFSAPSPVVSKGVLVPEMYGLRMVCRKY